MNKLESEAYSRGWNDAMRKEPKEVFENKDQEYYLNQTLEVQAGEPMNKDCICKSKHCQHYESDFDRFVKNENWKARFNEKYKNWIDKDNHLKDSVIDFIEQLLKKEREKTLAEEKQFILNVLDGIDIADKEAGVIGGTKAIRMALQSRV